MNYSEKLKHPKWQKKRLEIFNRDNFTCQKCNDKETELHVHHLQYFNKDPWEIDNKYLITLCEHCHFEIEFYKKNYLKDEKISLNHFKRLKIYKSNRWGTGDRIMFLKNEDICSMTIYNKKGEYLIGFDLDEIDITNIVPLLIGDL